MKTLEVGDLVVVIEERAMGGIANGSIGIIIEKVMGFNPTIEARWVIKWLFYHDGTAYSPLGETVSFGRGIKVLSSDAKIF